MYLSRALSGRLPPRSSGGQDAARRREREAGWGRANGRLWELTYLADSPRDAARGAPLSPSAAPAPRLPFPPRSHFRGCASAGSD